MESEGRARVKDVRTHWAEWRAGWEEKLNRGEVHMLRTHLANCKSRFSTAPR